MQSSGTSHRARPKGDEEYAEEQTIQTSLREILQNKHTLTSSQGVTNIRYDRTEITGSGFGVLGNVHHSHVHVHHHYHGVLQPLQFDPIVDRVTRSTLAAINQDNPNYAAAFDSNLQSSLDPMNISSTRYVDAAAQTSSSISYPNEIAIGYASIQQWLSSTDTSFNALESTTNISMETKTLLSSMVNSSQPDTEDNSWNCTFATCPETLEVVQGTMVDVASEILAFQINFSKFVWQDKTTISLSLKPDRVVSICWYESRIESWCRSARIISGTTITNQTTMSRYQRASILLTRNPSSYLKVSITTCGSRVCIPLLGRTAQGTRSNVNNQKANHPPEPTNSLLVHIRPGSSASFTSNFSTNSASMP